jgi:hypothetical protein
VQSFEPFVLRAGSNERVVEPLRYLVQRFAELADPHVHFAASATFSLNPVTATAEFLELARLHDLSRAKNPSHGVMRSAVHRTRNVLARDTHLKEWYGGSRDAAVDVLDSGLDDVAAAAAGRGRNRWLSEKVAAAGSGAVRTLHAELADSHTGYRSRLGEAVLAQTSAPITTPEMWRGYDASVRLLVGLLLSEGREGRSMSRAIASIVSRAVDTATAIQQIAVLLDAPPKRFIAAFRVPGVRHPTHSQAFDLRRVREADPRWTVEGASLADVDLASFVSDAPQHAVLTTNVDAFDRWHAYSLAMPRAERLVDQYMAEHRAYGFAVDPKMLILDVDRQLTSNVDQHPRTLPRPRALLKGPAPLVEQSLRFSALARDERVATVKILHYWIALESMVRAPGAGSAPYPFLKRHLPPLLALHAVRQSLSTTWHIARKAGRKSSRAGLWATVEEWLRSTGPENRLENLNTWVDLISALPDAEPDKAPPPLVPGASQETAAMAARYAMGGMTPFAAQSILQWKFLLSMGPRLSGWCIEMEARATAVIERMYVARNSAVHTALTEADGHRQLAHAAENIVDCVFEVLPPWLAASQRPDQAIERLSRRSRHVIQTWNRKPRAALIDAQHLTRPGGDGMKR